MQMLAAVVVLTAAVSVCNGQRTNFVHPVDTTLTCMAQNPLAGYPGQPYQVPVDIPKIPFQPGPPGEVPLPTDSVFESPLVGPIPAYLADQLLRFLGSDYNDRLTFVGESFPTQDPVLPSTILPVTVPGVSSGARPGGVGTIVAGRIDYTDDIRRTLSMLNPIRVPVTDYDFITDVANQLTSRCVPMPRWVRLQDFQYFPQWVSGAFCSGNNCSLPAGLTCQPILTEEVTVHVTVLRWDCCWSIQNLQWRWQCGWRKVLIPLVGRCHCGCAPIFSAPFSFTGRVGGSYRVSIPNLNT